MDEYQKYILEEIYTYTFLMQESSNSTFDLKLTEELVENKYVVA
jgi:hypothetical protein